MVGFHKGYSQKENIKCFLKMLLDSKEFSDVTLVCEDNQRVQAHKVVLSACSSYFKDILNNDSDEDETIIHLDHTKYEDIMMILDYIYCGEVSGSYINIKALKDTATNLRIYQLLESINEYETEIFLKLFILLSPKQAKIGKVPCDDKNQKKPQQADEQETKYYCQLCGQMFFPRTAFENHMLKSHDQSPYKCNFCGRKFPSRATMKYHIQYKHEGISYPCDFCDKRFSNAWNVKGHIKAFHTGFTFNCDQCEKQFKGKGNLMHHKKRMHEGIRYACTFCEHTTSETSNLVKHLKKWHLNEEQINSIRTNPGQKYSQWCKEFTETEESKAKKKAQSKMKRVEAWRKFVLGVDTPKSEKRSRRPKRSKKKEPVKIQQNLLKASKRGRVKKIEKNEAVKVEYDNNDMKAESDPLTI